MADDVEGCSRRRVAQPPVHAYMPSANEYREAWFGLLSKIESSCKEAQLRLAVSRFLDAGVCIGLLDPVSNILVNTICTSDRPEKVLVVEDKLPEMGRSSMKGLIAFLLYFFPCLAEWEAVRYLFLADADLITAARIIVADRGMLLSSRLHQLTSLLLEHSSSPLRDLHRQLAWELAARRAPYRNAITNMPYQHTRSLRMVLLHTIHGFYLQALARLPCSELRSHLHHSLLRAGYCYGPMDPVSNIIFNTIWYHANFPAAVTPVLEVIGPNSLARPGSRSFYGLVSFIQTRY